jgi:hypothetical protein
VFAPTGCCYAIEPFQALGVDAEDGLRIGMAIYLQSTEGVPRPAAPEGTDRHVVSFCATGSPTLGASWKPRPVGTWDNPLDEGLSAMHEAIVDLARRDSSEAVMTQTH